MLQIATKFTLPSFQSFFYVELRLNKGCEDLVRQAKFQKERYEAIASRLKSLVDQQTPQVDTLKSNLTSWESKISEAQNQVLSRDFNTSSPLNTFERIEEKVLQIAVDAEVVSQPDDTNEGSRVSASQTLLTR